MILLVTVIATGFVIGMESRRAEKELKIDLELEEAYFVGDEELLNQVWFNLMDNAVKFTEYGGRIMVSLRRKEDHINASVTDDGIGISVETMKHIYDHFYRGNTEKRYKEQVWGFPWYSVSYSFITEVYLWKVRRARGHALL